MYNWEPWIQFWPKIVLFSFWMENTWKDWSLSMGEGRIEAQFSTLFEMQSRCIFSKQIVILITFCFIGHVISVMHLYIKLLFFPKKNPPTFVGLQLSKQNKHYLVKIKDLGVLYSSPFQIFSFSLFVTTGCLVSYWWFREGSGSKQ